MDQRSHSDATWAPCTVCCRRLMDIRFRQNSIEAAFSSLLARFMVIIIPSSSWVFWKNPCAFIQKPPPVAASAGLLTAGSRWRPDSVEVIMAVEWCWCCNSVAREQCLHVWNIWSETVIYIIQCRLPILLKIRVLCISFNIHFIVYPWPMNR